MFTSAKSHPYVALARDAVLQHVRGAGTYAFGSSVDVDDELWSKSRACFVSIKKKNGELRGCIGTMQPVRETLDREIVMNAISAATRDPRFAPIDHECELDDLVFSVDVLSELEPVADRGELDPKRYGVLVKSGHKSGVLLPDLPGIDTVDQQISIASQKGMIGPADRVELFKFTVDRYAE